ncbi:MAG TPA: VTT domain-containing protein [Patescibacteria group bacterium]|nr:VTT domain-containing protein [Patescibacteria group bacterium]
MLEFLDTTAIIHTGGYLGMFAILFAETGLLVGLILPGESLLFTAGLLASSGLLNIWIVVSLGFLAAVLGDSLAYALGKRFGQGLFGRYQWLGLDQAHISRIQKFYNIHGRQTIVLARFIPFFRTVVPVLAGIGSMQYRTFLKFNFIGAAAWTLVVGFVGYFLGELVPDGSVYTNWIIAVIMILSVLPLTLTIFRRKKL